jgi:hypothetical protein
MRILTLAVGAVAILLVGSHAVAENPNTVPDLCVDTLDCGGFCGSVQQVNAFLNRCTAGPTGPCFDECFSTCTAGSQGQNPNPTACTLECALADCPDDNANSGLLQAGLIEECPLPDPAALCFQIYAPVECGGCEYGNSCIAAAAGFNPASCTDVGDTVIFLGE